MMVRRIDCCSGEQNIPCSDDAIPKGSISLRDAYWRLVATLMDGDRLEQSLDAGGADRKALVERRRPAGDARTDWELLSETRGRTSNVTLRWALEIGELVACVRDPETGDVLQLASEGWVDWDDDVPAQVTSNFIIPGEYDSIGPNGTLIRGALRPVFLIREEFESWLSSKFGDCSSTTVDFSSQREQRTSIMVGTGPAMPPTNKKGRRKPTAVHAAQEARAAIWEGKIPPGIPATKRDDLINDWLEKNGRAKVSAATIRRAMVPDQDD
ncbi:hypothetical protein [Bradyrhizobium zhanjiangense]|uniref:Uncharacterized protein n=1 Tax=Bradyrhizobium zhanjiangense TaxID=1325107 RepID=A0A4Q0Q515_9BRAD|nr:hypothetical protein [Bradyrhizobium zhanjiangense]RXG83814.1 hypothetical protein EAS61_40875 [Bradyrhizobium zhanjiangense]